MKFKIVSDSSSNLFQVREVPYCTVPLKIVAGDKEYVDEPGLDLEGMVNDLRKYKGKSGSSCPNVQEWLDAFEDAKNIFCVTITKNLSGSYNAAMTAAEDYMERYPDRKVFVFDSQSAGAELAMIVDKTVELILAGKTFEEIRDGVQDYRDHVHTLFCLQSMLNLARNGRVNPAVAKIAAALNIRVIGDAADGQLNPFVKPRGDKKAIQVMVEEMLKRGLYDGALVRISHCFNPALAQQLKEAIKAKLPNCRFIIEPTTALCSYYAEVGGLIVGYEGAFNEVNNTKM